MAGMNLEGNEEAPLITSFFPYCLTETNFPVPCSKSSQNQEAESPKGHPQQRAARADAGSAGRDPFHCPQVHAAARAHHAVAAEGHRAGHHLRRLRQHPPRHLHPAHDHPEQAGGAAGHLCREVGQGSARSVGNVLMFSGAEFKRH